MDAFTAALGETMAETAGASSRPSWPARAASMSSERGLRTVMNLQQWFFEAVAPYQQEIRHPNPAAALNLVFRSVIAGGAHRAAIEPWLPDGLTWQQWAREIADMTTAYLTAER